MNTLRHTPNDKDGNNEEETTATKSWKLEKQLKVTDFNRPNELLESCFKSRCIPRYDPRFCISRQLPILYPPASEDGRLALKGEKAEGL